MTVLTREIKKQKEFEMEKIGANLSEVVDRIVRQYEDFTAAFLKEAIQNSWDARKDRKTAEDWAVEIYTCKSGDKTHLVIEDFGTKGMDSQRWTAFQSLWLPKKESSDVGGQGQGKFILMGASKEHILVVESVSDEIPYRCKKLKDDEKSKDENICAIKDFVPSVQPLGHKGTKIWVYDVRLDFLNKLKTQQALDLIVESWWQILGTRFNAKIKLFNKEIAFLKMPQIIEEDILFENFSSNFGVIKRLVLDYYEKPIPKISQGIRVQRSNMMITKMPFEISKKEYQDRFSGYIEFDKSLEKKIKKIEKTDHCGFIYKSPWIEIKSLIKKEAEKFVNKIVPIKQEKSINIGDLSKIIEKANQIISDNLPEIIGSGKHIPPLHPKEESLLRIKYLHANKREAKFGDILKPSCTVINETLEPRKISLAVLLKRQGAKLWEEVYKLKIFAGEQKPIKLPQIELSKDVFQKGKYTIRATIKENNESKSTSFYLEEKREPVKKGFIKRAKFIDMPEEILRYKSPERGVININSLHPDFLNIYENFAKKPYIQATQLGCYLIKRCLDEAMNELIKIKLTEDLEPDDLVCEIQEARDKMYNYVYG